MLLPLPFGPMMPKNSPRSTPKETSSQRLLRSYADASEWVQEVFLERRALLVREPEDFEIAATSTTADVIALRELWGSRRKTSQSDDEIPIAIEIGSKRPPEPSSTPAAVILFSARSG